MLAEVVEVVTGEVWGEALWCDRVSAALALVGVGGTSRSTTMISFS